MNPITGLLIALGALTLAYIGGWGRAIAQVRRENTVPPTPATDAGFPSGTQIGVGALTSREHTAAQVGLFDVSDIRHVRRINVHTL